MMRALHPVLAVLLVACLLTVVGSAAVSAAETPGVCKDVSAIGVFGIISVVGDFPDNWEAADIKGFHFYRGTDPDNLTLHLTLTLRVIPIFKIFMYQDDGILNGVTYYYSVTAFNSEGEGPRSEVVNATVKGVPPAPQHLAGVANFTDIQLSWGLPLSDGGKPIVNYSVYRGLMGGDTVLIGNVTTLSFTDANIASGTFYNYEVCAVNGYGAGKMSGMIFVEVPMPVINGTILYSDGVPVEGATVALDQNATLGTTDANGSFSLQAYAGTHHMTVWVNDRLLYEGDLSSPRGVYDMGNVSLSVSSDQGSGDSLDMILLIVVVGVIAVAAVAGIVLIKKRKR
ncbi:MAG: fibronectin type III domain-containing protein [Methanomassiliicoccales archaeon]|nr:fibronectin type III domain-containing protein [Methanomassiliicoccales archaeon]